MALPRFYFVNAKKYFAGEICYGPQSVTEDDKIGVVDFKDMILQSVRVGDLKNVLNSLFYTPVVWHNIMGEISVTSNSMQIFNTVPRGVNIDLNGKNHYIQFYGHFAYIDWVQCMLDLQGGIFLAYDGGSMHQIMTKTGETSNFMFVFSYRLQDSLVLCYQLSRTIRGRLRTASISLIYELDDGRFRGFYVYGDKMGLTIKDEKYLIPSLAKEVLRG